TYGLEPAIGWLSLVSDSTPITLQFGETTAVGQNRYVAISGRPEVYIVSSALFDEANQPTEKFQDPLFLRINTWEVDHLALATPAQNLSLMRREGQWRMTDPFEDVADNTQANEFLARLTGMSISHVVELNPQVEKLSEWGLDQPRLEMRIHLPESSEPITVFFGKYLSDAESLVFAKRSDEPALFAVSAKEVDSLIVDPKSLRSKNCFSGSLDQVRKIRLERPGGVLELERLETRWREASSSRELDLSKVNAFVQELLALRFQSFVEEPQADGTSYGLKPAVSAIEIVLQEPQRLEIGNSADEEQTRYGYLKHRQILARIPEQASLLAAKNVEELLISADPPSQEH
ncbi:MAG: DUF4340 domain-containing protein, partial [Candidatus Omnitrophica bacterium]|nr:DUF4340 domain-containing protein [Candidatus Omnitrophota bacterium]